MKKIINTEHIEGRIYQHELKLKTVKNQQSSNFGKPFIQGSIDVATDEAGLNVLTVYFTYVTELTKHNEPNRTYTALSEIINNGKTWIKNGKDEATMVKIDTNFALNEFYPRNSDTLVSQMRNEGGFCTVVNRIAEKENDRNTFSLDAIITSVVRQEPENSDSYIILKGATFNFRNELLPIELSVRDFNGINYFEGLDINGSNPLFTNVWGNIVSSTVKTEKVTESAWGSAKVDTVERTVREWLVAGAAPVPYEFGDANTITREELTKAMQDREVHLAEVKQNAIEYRASQATAAPVNTIPKAGGNFNF